MIDFTKTNDFVNYHIYQNAPEIHSSGSSISDFSKSNEILVSAPNVYKWDVGVFEKDFISKTLLIKKVDLISKTALNNIGSNSIEQNSFQSTAIEGLSAGINQANFQAASYDLGSASGTGVLNPIQPDNNPPNLNFSDLPSLNYTTDGTAKADTGNNDSLKKFGLRALTFSTATQHDPKLPMSTFFFYNNTGNWVEVDFRNHYHRLYYKNHRHYFVTGLHSHPATATAHEHSNLHAHGDQYSSHTHKTKQTHEHSEIARPSKVAASGSFNWRWIDDKIEINYSFDKTCKILMALTGLINA